MITISQVRKRYGTTEAVRGMTFTVQPGKVTGFLGPNGAGKTTLMRIILGLDAATSGEALVAGRPYRTLPDPLRHVGALLEARGADKGRTARNHLRVVAASAGMPKTRADDILEQVGLSDVANKPVGGYSLGMGQRLGIGVALIGDPDILILDEPVNGLDPDGILWIRTLLKNLAAEGRTVFVSSHLMSEMEQTADHLVIVGHGEVLADTSMENFIAASGTAAVRVSGHAPKLTALTAAIASAHPGTTFDVTDTTVTVHGVDAGTVGEHIAALGVPITELVTLTPSLEEAFMTLTETTVQYHGHSATREVS